MIRAVIAPVMGLLLASCVTRPAFVPTPAHVFGQFVALREPRSELPVGALWIDGYGPTGDGAPADNLMTLKSLSGVTFDNGFQASLTLGLLKFLNVDPSYSRKMTAHFSDLTIVRVKDMSKLAGPAEQPRIYEALKAGTITITAIGNAGLDIENHAISQNLNVFGRGTSGIAHTFTIDGKDMFIAFEVATSRLTKSSTASATVGPAHPAHLSLEGLRITATVTPSQGKCLALDVSTSSGDSPPSGTAKLALDGAPLATLLAPPVGDGHGGVFTQLELSAKTNGPRCGAVVSAMLTGNRLERQRGKQPVEL